MAALRLMNILFILRGWGLFQVVFVPAVSKKPLKKKVKIGLIIVKKNYTEFLNLEIGDNESI